MAKFRQLLNQIRQSFLGYVSRAGKKAQVTGLDDEILDEIEIIQQVGFSSWLPNGSRVILLPLNGKSSRSVIIGSTESPIFIQAEEGQTIIYDQFGHQILLHENGVKIVGNVEIEGSLNVTDDINSESNVIDGAGSIHEVREKYNSHKHGSSPTPLPIMETENG